MVDVARVAAFLALVLWILRLTHATDDRPAYVRQKAHQGRLSPSHQEEARLARLRRPDCRPRRPTITSGRGRLTMPRTHGALGVVALARQTSEAVGKSWELA